MKKGIQRIPLHIPYFIFVIIWYSLPDKIFQNLPLIFDKWFIFIFISVAANYFCAKKFPVKGIDDKTAAELLKNNERFRRTQRIAKIGSWELDLINNTLYWSDEVFRIFEVEPEKFGVTYEAFLGLVHPEDIELVNTAYKNSLANKQPYEIVHRLKMKNGRVKYVKENCETDFDGNGNPLISRGTVHDTTEQKQAEMLSQEYVAQYSVLLETILDGFCILDSNGRFLEVNNNYCKMSSYTREELLKLAIHDVEASETLEETEQHVKEVIETGADRFETKHKTKDGKIWDAEISTIFVHNKQQFVVSIRDISERKMMLAELRLKENAIANSINATVMTNKDGVINYINKSFIKMWSYENEDEIIGRSAVEFVESPQKIFEAIEHLIKYNNWIGEVTAVKKDGSKFIAHITASAVNVNGNENLSLYASIIDMTEHKKYEKEIYKLAQTVEQNPVSILITDSKGNIEYVNKKFVELTGYTYEDVLNKNPRILQSGLTSRELYKSMWKALNEGKEWFGELQNKRKDGTYYWQALILSPIRDISGNIIHYLAIQRDITYRKSLELELEKYRAHLEELVEKRTNELRVSEEKFRALAENSEDVIMRFDNQCRHLYSNPIVTRMTGVPYESLIGRTHKELGSHDHLVGMWKNAVKKVFVTKEKNRIEFQLPNRIWIDWVLVPEFDNDGNVNTVITSGRDITPIKEYEKRIEESLQKEKELNELKNKFISTASHEFRTPLTAIQSSAQMIRRYSHKWDQNKLDEHYERINESILYLTQLLDGVLTISRTENDKIIFQPEPIDLKNYIEEIVEETNPLRNNNHEIIYKHNTTEQMFMLDRSLIKYIFNNLLSNAIKYSPRGGKIELGIEQIKNHLFIKVKDEGIGIPEEEIELIFNPFYRTKNTVDIPGTGLGLDIVKRAVELHNGQISVTSKVNTGTEFTITIPIQTGSTS